MSSSALVQIPWVNVLGCEFNPTNCWNERIFPVANANRKADDPHCATSRLISIAFAKSIAQEAVELAMRGYSASVGLYLLIKFQYNCEFWKQWGHT